MQYSPEALRAQRQLCALLGCAYPDEQQWPMREAALRALAYVTERSQDLSAPTVHRTGFEQDEYDILREILAAAYV
jgi:hypothetical protein